MSVVGFDVGDQFSVVSVIRNGRVDVLQNPMGRRKTCSMVAFTSKNRVIGDAAKDQYSNNHKNTVSNFKRLLGKNFTDPGVVRDCAGLTIVPVQSKGKEKVGVQLSYEDKTEVFTGEQIFAAMLENLKEVAAAGLDGQQIKDCVISCPCYWSDAERRSLMDAARIAGLNPLRIMNDTTALALSYGLLRTLADDKPVKVLFYDMGHTRTQVCLAEFVKGSATIIATSADAHLGGRDFDRLLVEYFATYIKDKYKMDVLSKRKSTLKLEKECARVKHVLSANNVVNFNVEYIMNDTDVKGQIKRQEFEELAAPLLARALKPLEDVLRISKVQLADIQSLELVGGASRVPCIQAALQAFFTKQLSFTCDADESIARGCALQCAMLSRTVRVRPFTVKDQTPYSVEVKWAPAEESEMQTDDAETTDSDVLFPPRHTIPSTRAILFKHRNSFNITAQYTQASDDINRTLPHQATENPVIGSWTVSGIPPKDQKDPAIAGEKLMKAIEKSIKVQVKLDANGILDVRGAQFLAKREVEVDTVVDEEVEEEIEVDEPVVEAKSDTKDNKDDAPTEAMDTSSDDKKDEPKTKKVKKKVKKTIKKTVKKTKTKTVTTSLTVQGGPSGGMEAKALEALIEREGQMRLTDKVVRETSDARDALESYVLEMRSEVRGDLSDFVTPADSKLFCDKSMEMEDWLYEDGFDVQKSEYIRQVEAMKKLGDPIAMRAAEFKKRPGLIAEVENNLRNWRGAASTPTLTPEQEQQYNDQKANSKEKETDRKAFEMRYSHISQSDKEAVNKKCAEVETRLRDLVSQQQQLPKTANPVLLCQMMRDMMNEVNNHCKPLMNKPKPKVQPKKKENQKNAETPEAKTEPAPETKDVPMSDADASPTPEKDIEID